MAELSWGTFWKGLAAGTGGMFAVMIAIFSISGAPWVTPQKLTEAINLIERERAEHQNWSELIVRQNENRFSTLEQMARQNTDAVTLLRAADTEQKQAISDKNDRLVRIETIVVQISADLSELKAEMKNVRPK